MFSGGGGREREKAIIEKEWVRAQEWAGTVVVGGGWGTNACRAEASWLPWRRHNRNKDKPSAPLRRSRGPLSVGPATPAWPRRLSPFSLVLAQLRPKLALISAVPLTESESASSVL